MSNIKIVMPEDSTGHTGIVLDAGSTITVADVVSYKSNLSLHVTILKHKLEYPWRRSWYSEL